MIIGIFYICAWQAFTCDELNYAYKARFGKFETQEICEETGKQRKPGYDKFKGFEVFISCKPEERKIG